MIGCFLKSKTVAVNYGKISLRRELVKTHLISFPIDLIGTVLCDTERGKKEVDIWDSILRTNNHIAQYNQSNELRVVV